MGCLRLWFGIRLPFGSCVEIGVHLLRLARREGGWNRKAPVSLSPRRQLERKALKPPRSGSLSKLVARRMIISMIIELYSILFKVGETCLCGEITRDGKPQEFVPIDGFCGLGKRSASLLLRPHSQRKQESHVWLMQPSSAFDAHICFSL